MELIKCPKCHKPNEDNWPLDIDGKVKWGGCQDCWEEESSRMYWESIRVFWEMIKDEVGINSSKK